ncbi:MAG: DUF1573 domain-containing protein [Opitutaceae bacterium]
MVTLPLRASRVATASITAVALAASVAAELKWDQPELSAKIRAQEAETHASFGFVNAGEQPVTITEIRPGCGCTVPALAKSTFAPGERGEFTIAYHPGNREGLHRVDITVTTDDGTTSTVTYVADIEALVSFDTRFVYWKGNEPRQSKRIRLSFAPGQNARLTGVQSSDPRFGVTFRPVGDTGREFEIEVTPPAEALDYTAITLHTLVGEEQASRQFTVVARTM